LDQKQKYQLKTFHPINTTLLIPSLNFFHKYQPSLEQQNIVFFSKINEHINYRLIDILSSETILFYFLRVSLRCFQYKFFFPSSILVKCEPHQKLIYYFFFVKYTFYVTKYRVGGINCLSFSKWNERQNYRTFLNYFCFALTYTCSLCVCVCVPQK
jgi:hypothetical protein